MKKLFALCLIVIMLFAFVGCGKEKRQIIKLTLSTEDSEAILAAAGIMLPDAETAAGAGTTVKYFSWYDSFHNYGEDEVINTGYWTFSEKYGSEVEWIECEWGKRFDDLANLVLSSNSPDFYPGESNTFPIRPIKGIFQPVDDYIDYDDPLWSGMKEFVYDYFSIKGRPYIIATDNAFGNVCIYNRRVMEEWGFDDPAELYANDEWTWDVFYEMCMEFSDPDEDRYALDGWYVVNSIVEESSGVYLLDKDENGKFFSNLDSTIIEFAQNMIYDLVKNECCYHEGTNYWANRNQAQYGAGVKDGLCLFWICDRDDGFRLPVEEMNNIWGDIEAGEFMFAPLPRYQDGDGIYYLNAMPKGYMICKGATNPEGVALLASCERFKILDPTVVDIDEKQLREVYKWSDEMIEMARTCNQIVADNPKMFYTGNLPQGLQDVYNTFDWNIRRSGATSTWAQLKESNQERFDYYIDELNAMIEEYNAGGTV